MSCNTCQTKFSFFTKDIGCPSCGFSCCSKCLKYKCNITNIGTKKVCGRCYNKLNNMKKSNFEDTTNDVLMSDASKEPLAPIDITKKLDSLENPVKPPIVMYKHINHWDKLKKGLEPADQQIVDRLQKLKDKEQNIPLPTVEEIKRRLALLKDQYPEASGSNITNIHQVDTRTDQEKADALIQEYLAQLELPSTNEPYKEIEERLNSLRDKSDKTCFNEGKREEINIGEKIFDMTNDDDLELINKISAMAIVMETPLNIKDEEKDEGEDENEDEDEDKDEDEEDRDEKECEICWQTVDKVDLYRCKGCTDKLQPRIYCLTCFSDFHDDVDEPEMSKHKRILFMQKGALSSAKMSLIKKFLMSDSQKNSH